MSNLREIRARLHAVENIKKITDTMERVAAARLKKAQAKAEENRPYAAGMKVILEKVSETGYSHPLFEGRDVKKTGIIIIGADRGLCGPYNSDVIRIADQFLKEKNIENCELLLFGQKIIRHYKKTSWHIFFEIPEWGGKISFEQMKQFVDHVVHAFLSGYFDDVMLLYTKYITVARKELVLEKLLPIQKPQNEDPKRTKDYIFEPNPAEILSELLPRYSVVKIQAALAEAFAAELGARIIAMQKASKNSSEVIRNLTLLRNRVRQESITKEMIEIATGAEGIN